MSKGWKRTSHGHHVSSFPSTSQVAPPPSGGTVYFAWKGDSGGYSGVVGGGSFSSYNQVPVVDMPISGPLLGDVYGLEFAFPGGGGLKEQRFAIGSQLTSMWLSYYMYVPAGVCWQNTAHALDNNKFLRLWSGDEADGFQGYGDYAVKFGCSTASPNGSCNTTMIPEMGCSTAACAGTGVGQFGKAGSGQIMSAYAGSWVKVEYYGQMGTGIGTNDGHIRLFLNESQIWSYTTCQNMYPSCPSGGRSKKYFDRGYLFGATNGPFAVTTTFYLARIRMANTREAADPDNVTGWT